ncbi:MAG TPA: LuxR C-terminal-related transcriptional regulator, partial [Gaiellaceae bacterium]|nr:LuxR C-terminal-related transcriptional regulator [Gaiellaceae bacterium]
MTPRELEVLRLVARGLSNSDIARELVVGDATIKTQVARIFSKLDLHDRAQAQRGQIGCGEWVRQNSRTASLKSSGRSRLLTCP